MNRYEKTEVQRTMKNFGMRHQWNDPARTARVTLTDKSIAHNVIANLDGQEFVFACQTARHADVLANAINQASWIERS